MEDSFLVDGGWSVFLESLRADGIFTDNSALEDFGMNFWNELLE